MYFCIGGVAVGVPVFIALLCDYFIIRLLILACLVTWGRTTTTNPREAGSPLGGQLPRPFSTGGTPQRAMCGAMGW